MDGADQSFGHAFDVAGAPPLHGHAGDGDGAQHNGAWADLAWLKEDEGEEEVPCFALHGNLLTRCPLGTDPKLKKLGARRVGGVWHVPFFHADKPKDPSGQWNRVLTWFYVALQRELNPDHPRAKSRGSVKNYLIHTTDGQCWRNSTMENRFNEAIATAAPPPPPPGGGNRGPPYAGAQKAPRHLKRPPTGKGKAPRKRPPAGKGKAPRKRPPAGKVPRKRPPTGRVPRKVPPQALAAARQRAAAAAAAVGQEDSEEDSSDDDDAGHAGVMGRKMAATRAERQGRRHHDGPEVRRRGARRFGRGFVG